MLTLMCAAVAMGQPLSTPPFAQWGRQTLDSIKQDFLMQDGLLYANDRKLADPPTQVAFNWGVGVMLSALNAAARFDPSYKEPLRKYLDASMVYWNPAPPVAGFDVLPMPNGPDRYYDDNEWMVLQLVEAYDTLKDAKYLKQADETLKFVLSGMDDKLGGGIYWRESDKASKNTCSNAPGVAAIMAVYKHYKRPDLLEKAKAIYAWTKQNLQDPEDGLMWDGKGLDGGIGKAKWTYNTGLMIRSAKDLYAVTKDKTYLSDAEAMEIASLKHWLPTPTEDGVRCEGKFAHLLFDSYAVAPAFKEGIAARDLALTFVHDKVKDSKGHYGHRWSQAAEADYQHFEMIDQASAARAYFVAAKGL